VLGNVFRDGLAPEDRRLEHVALSTEQSFFLRARAGGDRGDGDALDLALAVNHRVDRLDVTVGQGGGLFRQAEI